MLFLRTWLKWLALLGLALLVERALLGWTWLFILAALLTLLLFALFTSLLYGDWRAARQYGGGYRYDIFRDISRK
jgi:hypothetical protein